MKNLLVKFLLFVLVLSVTFAAVACTSESQQAGAEKKEPIVFADAGWDSLRFHNHVAGIIIKHGYGYEYDITPGSTPTTIAGLRNGDIDVYMEVWTDNIMDIYQPAVESGDIIELGVNFDDNAQGLYVPTYVIKGDPERGIEPMAPDLKSVSDLPRYWELFKDPEEPSKGRIVGSPAGWKVDEILVEKMKTYSLEANYNYLRPGSDTALAASIAGAYEKGEPWLGYYWEPTWIMGKYDMTLLEEPEYSKEKWNNGYACEFAPVRVTIAVHKDILEKAPEVVEFLKKYKTTSSLVNEALAYMQENEASAEDAAVWFLKEHEEIWTKWVSEEVAEKIKAELNN
jgi:glycine betaine/proline transport system substrate-binding protein